MPIDVLEAETSLRRAQSASYGVGASLALKVNVPEPETDPSAALESIVTRTVMVLGAELDELPPEELDELDELDELEPDDPLDP